MEIVDKILK